MISFENDWKTWNNPEEIFPQINFLSIKFEIDRFLDEGCFEIKIFGFGISFNWDL